MRVILSAKVVWVATNDANVAESVQTASIIARKSLKICCDGGPDVLSPSYAVGAEGTRGAGDVDDVRNGAMTVGAVDDAIWGSSISSAGWSTAMSSATS